MAELTPSQTIGPFWHTGLQQSFAAADGGTEAGSTQALVVTGHVFDGDGKPVTDAMLEVWQAGGAGGRFVRVATDANGGFAIATLMPGSTPSFDGVAQAPHLSVSLFARGLLDRVWFRMYFDDQPDNPRDPVLQCVPTERRATLLAQRTGAGQYRFDVRLRGERETVFFRA